MRPMQRTGRAPRLAFRSSRASLAFMAELDTFIRRPAQGRVAPPYRERRRAV